LRKKTLILFLVFIFLISLGNSQFDLNPLPSSKPKPQNITNVTEIKTYVNEHNIIINATRPIYYCQPIYKDDKCLVIIDYYVENTDIVGKTINIKTDFEQSLDKVEIKEYLETESSTKKISMVKTIDTSLLDKSKTSDFSIGTNERKKMMMEVWASESGKFNITVNINGIAVILDPIINVSINSTFPSYHLINGTNDLSNRDEYFNYTEISAGLSDNSSTTNYSITLGRDINLQKLWFGYTMNELKGNIAIDYSPLTNDLTLINSPILTVEGVEYTSLNLDGTQYGMVGSSTDFDVNENESIMICLSFNTSENFGNGKGLVHRRLSGDGIRYKMKSDETIECTVDRGTSVSLTASTSSYNDGQWHTTCCYNNASNGEGILYMDGIEVDRNPGSTGDITNSRNFHIGSADGGSNKFKGQIDEVCAWKSDQGISPDDVALFYNTTYCINETLQGSAVQTYFNISLNTSEQHFLKIVSNAVATDILRVWPMINDTNINTTNYIDKQISGSTSFIPINSIIYDNYNSPFRISQLEPESIDIYDIYLIESLNDTQDPVVNSCYWDTNSIGCSGYATLFCNVTDDSGIDFVSGLIFAPSLIDQNAISNVTDTLTLVTTNGLWFRNYSSACFESLLTNVNWTFGQNINFSILEANATDIAGKNTTKNFSENEVYVEYQCIKKPNKPIMTSPANNSLITAFPLLFSWNATDPNNDSLTSYLYLNQSNPPASLFITTNSTNYSCTGGCDGTYYARVRTNDGLYWSDYSDTITFTVDVGDLNITLISPSDLASIQLENGINFTYNIISNNNLSNCSFYANSILQQTDTSPINGSINSFTYHPSISPTTWYIKCYDILGNSNVSETRTLTTTQAGGGGGGGSSGEICGNNYCLEDKENATSCPEDCLIDIIVETDTLLVSDIRQNEIYFTLESEKYSYQPGEDIFFIIKTYINNDLTDADFVKAQVTQADFYIGTYYFTKKSKGIYELIYPNDLDEGTYTWNFIVVKDNSNATIEKKVNIAENPTLVNYLYTPSGKISPGIILMFITIVILFAVLIFVVAKRKK